MDALLWLAIPIVALLLALLYVVWASRPKPPADPQDTMEGYARFRDAMEGRRHRRGFGRRRRNP